MSKNEFLIILFDDGPQIVCSEWMTPTKKHILYPTCKTMYSYYNTVRTKKTPEPTWTKESIVEKIAEAGTFERGLEKLKAYENESDVNTDVESKRKRKYKKAKPNNDLRNTSKDQLSPEISRPSVLQVKKALSFFPKPPLGLKKNDTTVPQSPINSATSSKTCTNNSSQGNNLTHAPFEKSPSAVSTSSFTTASLQANDHSSISKLGDLYKSSKRIRLGTDSDPSKTKNKSPTSFLRNEFQLKGAKSSSWSDEHMFRKNVTKSFNDIKFMLSVQKEQLDEMQEKQLEHFTLQERFLECQSSDIKKHVKKDRTSQFRSQFPVATLDDLQNIEDSLTLPDYRNDMISYFSGFGGKHAKETTYVIMKAAFSNKIGSLFNWSGKKNKLNFSRLQLTSVILETVRQVCKVKDNQVIESIKDWLRHSSARLLRESANNEVNVDDGIVHNSDDDHLSVASSSSEEDHHNSNMNIEENFKEALDASERSNDDQNSKTGENTSDTDIDDTQE